ncbi:hypothetical protein BpHYR1_001379 [Brachionus plicatilis]|uniref:SWIM-type domain-containing protein n=1 Tax=Brachionus plicatilis TaxID=10195 RepID=A0A3M7REM3_BRAPC|nr:hypothetical protein BpHYR1_001379 [Brachionus plicatilis]
MLQIDVSNILDEHWCDVIDYTNDKPILNNSIRIVRTNPDNWKFSKCTCYDYFKTWMCKHILVIAIANNQIYIPEKYFDSEIGSKPKPEAYNSKRKEDKCPKKEK